MKRTAGAVLVAILALAGCGDGGTDSVTIDASPEGLARAASRTLDGESARFRAAMTLDMAGQTVELAMEGAYDGAGRSEMTMDLAQLLGQFAPGQEVPGLDGPVRFVADGDVLYLCGPLLSFFGEDAECGSIDVGVDTTSFGTSNDPTAFLRTLAGADLIEEIGTEDVDGVETTHLRGTYSLQDALAALDTDQAEQLERQLAALGDELDDFVDDPVPFDVWIDEQGRVRRSVIEVALPVPGAPGSAQVDMRFTDFGEDIVVEVPEDAVDLSRLLPDSEPDSD